MGIKLLNRFLKDLRVDGIKQIKLSQLSEKRIVIDANIYMYRFSANNNIIEEFYSMCSILKYYDIHALFIFDGSNKNSSKYKVIQERKKLKEKNKKKLNELLEKKPSSKKQIKLLKYKCSSYSKQDLCDVKELLVNYGFKYLEADGEADELCASLVLEKKAYACLTEDTDLFVYGCPRILKYFSYCNDSVMYYDVYQILKQLNIPFDDFQNICCLSGNDYSTTVSNNLFKNVEYFKEYGNTNSNITFLDWMIQNNYILNEEYKNLIKFKEMYNINTKDIISNLPYFIIKNKYSINYKLKKLLKKHGFVFVNNLSF